MADAAQALSEQTRAPRFHCYLATCRGDMEASQRLRHLVFAQEMGARITPKYDARGAALESDGYDAYCRHLLVRDTRNNMLVASTRILTDANAPAAGGFYSAHEFDIAALLAQPGRFMEIGRTCVHPDYRRGGVIAVLWSGIADFIQRGGYRHLIGCASIDAQHGFGRAHGIFRQLEEHHSLPVARQVRPRLPVPPSGLPTGTLRLPPLLKAYISLGARVGGPPCWDPEFRVVDLLMHLQIENLCPRYARHFHCQPRDRQPMAAVS